MEIASHSLREMTVLRLQGDLTCLARSAFQDAAQAGREGGCRTLLFDLAAVTFIDSAAPGMSMLSAQSWKLAQRRVALIRLKSHVRELLHTQHILTRLPIYEPEGAAMAAPLSKTGAA